MDLQMKNMLTAVKNALHNTNEPLEQPDFDIIFEKARKQSILPIVYQGCSSDKAFEQYESSLKLMKTIYSILSLQSQRTAAFEELYEKLVESGVKPLVLKGLLCRSLYGELCDHRASGDEDILIPIEDYKTAKKILIENGYFIENENAPESNLSKVQEITFYNADKKLKIELHVNLFTDTNEFFNKINSFFENSFDDMVSFKANGKEYYTLEYTKNYLFLFFHIFKHFIGSGVGLRPLIDLFMFEKEFEHLIDWALVENIIKDLSAWRFHRDLIAIGNEYLGFDLKQRSESVNTEMLIMDIENAGTFGVDSESQARSSAFTMVSVSYSGIKKYIKLLFPDRNYVVSHYPEYYGKSFFLPVVWVKRICKYIPTVLKRNNIKDIKKADVIAKKRVELLKEYKIIK